MDSNDIQNSISKNLKVIRNEIESTLSDTNVKKIEKDSECTELLIEERLNKLKSSNLIKTARIFDFESNKTHFDDMYFSNSKFFKKNSKENIDFWIFLKKYQALMRRKQHQLSNIPQSNEYSEKLKLPLNYDKKWRLNFLYNPLKTNISSYDSFGNTMKQEILEEHYQEFEFIIHLYLDFSQKEKFKKLKQLRKNQSNLPIFKYKEAILNTIKDNQVTIVAGDTGCGKSTQIPRYLLESGFEKICCTQPRRIACMSLAKRVSYETLNEFKSEVAYQVRFEKTRTRHTKILFLTEGVLLRQIQTDSNLSQYDIIVVDEVHERHVFTDFLLGILKCLIRKRTDLKIILMSATINIDLFSNYFDNCVIFKIPGRTYKIDVEYLPITKEKDSSKSSKIDPSPFIRIMTMIDKKYPENERGDMLIFLSGLSDIQTVYEAAKEYANETKRWVILPLHSTLSIEDQEKVFDIPPEGVRKCIISTNISETSVTIDGLRFIVDSGKVKEISYDPKYKMQRLQEFWISRASAEQRKGRAGRTGPGVCFRLYSIDDYNAFSEFSTPEIKRVPLDTLLLQMIAMGLKDVRKFPFIEPPSEQNIEHSLQFLVEHNALNENEELTPMGEMLSQLPVDIPIGKMLIMASIFHVIDPIVTMAAGLSVQSPFVSNLRCDYETMQMRKDLISDHGDPLTLLNAYNEWIQIKSSDHGNSSKWCKRRGIEEQRFYEMTKLKKQFNQILEENYLQKNRKNIDSEDDEEEQVEASTSKNYNKKLKDKYEKLHEKQERKRLLQIKKELINKPKRPKMLDLNDLEVDMANLEQDHEQDYPDIRDIDFKLMHNLNELQNKSLKCKKYTLGQVNLLKIILTCGLSTQLAIGDEFNSFKRDSDQCFHSKYKSFVILHPTSIFSYDPDILAPPDDGVTIGKLKFSTRHQLLVYVNLFETNKPYFMNCMRVPALQTLLLYSKNLDTNSNCTRIICDGWLEIKFQDPVPAQKVVSAAICLRSSIEKLFKIRIQDHQYLIKKMNQDVVDLNDYEEKMDHYEEMNKFFETSKERAKSLERVLKKKLTEFVDSSVLYSLRRILPAEMKILYVKQFAGDDSAAQTNIENIENFSKLIDKEKSKINGEKGGIKINDYLTYNCLVSDETQSIVNEYSGNMKRHWKCQNCKREYLFDIKERMEHEVDCNMNFDSMESKIDENDKTLSLPNKNEYFCSICNKSLNLTSIEILKHKKSHDNT